MSSESFMEYTPMLDTQFGEITPCLSILHCSLFLFHTFLGLSCHHEHVVSIHHILPRVLNCRDIDCPLSRFNPSLKFVWKHVSRDNDAWSMDLWVWHGMLFSKEPISMNPSFLFLQPFLWLQKKTGPRILASLMLEVTASTRMIFHHLHNELQY